VKLQKGPFAIDEIPVLPTNWSVAVHRKKLVDRLEWRYLSTNPNQNPGLCSPKINP